MTNDKSATVWFAINRLVKKKIKTIGCAVLNSLDNQESKATLNSTVEASLLKCDFRKKIQSFF